MRIARPGIIAVALAVTMLVGATGSSFARGGAHHGGYGMNTGTRAYQAPALTQEQISIAEKCHEEFRAATEQTRKQLILREAELQAELSVSNPDQSKVVSISKEIGELRGQMLSSGLELQTKLEAAGISGYRHSPCFADGSYRHGGMQGYHNRGGNWGRGYHNMGHRM